MNAMPGSMPAGTVTSICCIIADDGGVRLQRWSAWGCGLPFTAPFPVTYSVPLVRTTHASPVVAALTYCENRQTHNSRFLFIPRVILHHARTPRPTRAARRDQSDGDATHVIWPSCAWHGPTFTAYSR
eukprot:2623282-Prymnesium_polylepis.1